MQLATATVEEFLRRWSDRWSLTAIHPDRRGAETRSFSETADALAWVTGKADHNLYFHVNPVRVEDRKAEKNDVKALAWLHVDMDPRAGEDLAAEQARILARLSSPPSCPPPTVVVFSGGGYQGFWRLREPLPWADEAAAVDAARYNRQLEVLFEGDNCHDVSRIMRLPGTINWPNERKRKKGRVPTLSALVSWDETRLYDLAAFNQAPLLQEKGGGLGGPTGVKVSGNVQRVLDLSELPAGLDDRTKSIIAQGQDPVEPMRLPSRSEWLFFACCQMVRAGCTDDVIYAIITDPEWRISSSVIDKGHAAEKYALHQIKRAKEHAIDPWLEKLNEKHAVIGDLGGKCRVISEVWDASMKRPRISKQSFEDFRNRYMNVKVEVGKDKDGHPVKAPLGKWWLEHAARRQFETMTFAPGTETPNAYNLWRGFACESKPGNCDLFLEHIHENICSGNEEYYAYLMNWMAGCVQRPDRPGETAVVLRGRMGTGKSFFAENFGSLFGRHYLQVAEAGHLVGHFNAHLRDCVLLFSDEAFYAGDRKHEPILKMLVTAEMIPYEPKGVDMEQGRNFVHLMLASNEAWVVPAGLDDRRFFVLDVAGRRRLDTNFFEAVRSELDSGGREALLHALLNRNLTEFNVRLAPRTAALQDQKLYSLSPIEEWWYEKLQNGRLMPSHAGWTGRVYANELVYDFFMFTKHVGRTAHGGGVRLGQFLTRACPVDALARKQTNETIELPDTDGRRVRVVRPYVYDLPNLDVARRHWDNNFGGPYTWPAVDNGRELVSDKTPF